jgi:hypothetical protein
MQLQSSVIQALQAILRREGVRGLYRGLSAVVIGAGPSHAVYFATYEAAKEMLGGNEAGHHPMATAAAGQAAMRIQQWGPLSSVLADTMYSPCLQVQLQQSSTMAA